MREKNIELDYFNMLFNMHANVNYKLSHSEAWPGQLVSIINKYNFVSFTDEEVNRVKLFPKTKRERSRRTPLLGLLSNPSLNVSEAVRLSNLKYLESRRAEKGLMKFQKPVRKKRKNLAKDAFRVYPANSKHVPEGAITLSGR